MRIGIISLRDAEFWGGNEELWYHTALEAARSGHQVVVSLCDFKNNEERLKQLTNAGVQFNLRKRANLPANRVARKIKFIWVQYKRKMTNPYRWMVQQKPDVLLLGQAGTFDFYNNGYVQQVIKELGKPAVLNSQYLAEHVILPKAQIKNVQRLSPLITRFTFVSQRNLQNFERMTCQRLGEEAVVVQNPVKTKAYQFVQWSPEATLQLALVGRLICKDKGQDIVLQLLAAPLWRNRNWQLNIYGRGEDEFYLQELVKLYQLESKVHFHGFENDVLNIWKKNHVLLMPSFSEGTPLTLLEALSCGRPSVVTDVGGNSNFVKEGETGFIAEAPSLYSFGNALERLWNRKDDLEQMGQKALELARQRISLSPEKDLVNVITGCVK